MLQSRLTKLNVAQDQRMTGIDKKNFRVKTEAFSLLVYLICSFIFRVGHCFQNDKSKIQLLLCKIYSLSLPSFVIGCKPLAQLILTVSF